MTTCKLGILNFCLKQIIRLQVHLKLLRKTHGDKVVNSLFLSKANYKRLQIHLKLLRKAFDDMQIGNSLFLSQANYQKLQIFLKFMREVYGDMQIVNFCLKQITRDYRYPSSFWNQAYDIQIGNSLSLSKAN